MAAVTAIVSTALAVGGATKSFLDASKQETARKEANAAADIAMNDARKKLDENFYEGLDINLKSFEQERNALAGVGQQLVQAGQEGERGAGAMAGRVMLGVQKAEQEITNRQIGSMENLEKLVAGEESRLQGQRVALDLGEAEGAQLAARDAAAAKNAAITQGVTQLGQAGMTLYENSELYGKGKNDPITGNPNSFGEYKKVGGEMSRSDFRNILGGGTKAGNIFSSVGGGAENLFNGIFGGN
jgi:hypothetical protein|tara:strand:+ start:84 stop:812 length:729 start_codon:yes stop_codon:yes gene_type:complete